MTTRWIRKLLGRAWLHCCQPCEEERCRAGNGSWLAYNQRQCLGSCRMCNKPCECDHGVPGIVHRYPTGGQIDPAQDTRDARRGYR